MASFDGTAITIDELKNVLTSLKEQRDTINSTYNSMVRGVLESSSSCFSVSGLSYDNIISSFDKTFKELNSNFNTLIDVLDKNVIQNYSELAIAIKKMFGTDFAKKMSELLDLR